MANLLFFGDSITEGFWDGEGGWVERTRKQLFAETIRSGYIAFHRFYNLGVSGDNTESLLTRFENEIKVRTEWEKKEDNVIIIAIGINDSQVYQETGKTRVPFEKFKENIHMLISQARKYADTISFVGLTPVDERKVDPSPWTPEKSYKNDSIKRFNNAVKSICDSHSIPFIAVLEEWLGQPYPDLLSDGLHPNTKGHETLFATIYPQLQQILHLP